MIRNRSLCTKCRAQNLIQCNVFKESNKPLKYFICHLYRLNISLLRHYFKCNDSIMKTGLCIPNVGHFMQVMSVKRASCNLNTWRATCNNNNNSMRLKVNASKTKVTATGTSVIFLSLILILIILLLISYH